MALAPQMVIPADLTEGRPTFTGHHLAMSFPVLRIVFLHLLLLGKGWLPIEIMKGMFHVAITGRFLSPVKP